MDKYLKLALDTLGLSLSETNTEKDIDLLIKEQESSKAKMENLLIDAKEVIEDAKENIELLLSIKHQMKVERYKELNPDIEVF